MRDFLIGSNSLNGRNIYLTLQDLLAHMLTIGGTRRGKSKLAEREITYHIANKHGLICLDPHGFLYEDLLAYVTAHRYRDRVILINPNDSNYCVGLNFLAPNGVDSATQAAGIMKAIFKVFGEDRSEETKPRLERWLRNLLITFIEAGLPLSDALDFLAISNYTLRKAIIQKINNPYVQAEWEQFEDIKKRSDKETLIESVLNRAAKLILSEQVRRIMGQLESTIDIQEIVETGKVVLVNLQPLKVSREAMQILGILLIDQIVNYARTRTKFQAKTKPFFVFVDEASELTSNDLPYGLQALAKYGIFFRLFFQNLEMIKKQNLAGYFDNVMSNCDIKIAFKTSYKDAEELVGDFFAGKIRGDKVKLDILRYDILPKETTREISTLSESQAETDGVIDSEGDFSGSGSGSGMLSGSGSGQVDVFIPESFGPDNQITYSKTSFDSFGSSNFSSSSFGSSSMHGDVRSTTRGKSISKSVVPFYQYLIQQNLGSRQYYSIEEIKEKFIAWMMCQPQRHAQLKLGDKSAIPIITAYVPEVKQRAKDIQTVITYSNERYALPTPIVDKMIEERRKVLLAVPEDVKDEEEDRWEKT